MEEPIFQQINLGYEFVYNNWDQYFHGHLQTTELGIRAWALAQNFLPYCLRAGPSEKFISSVHRLNGKVYHHNWLENPLVSSSLGGAIG